MMFMTLKNSFEKRTVIKIDEVLCNGCGICAAACHEGAIKVIDGVARLVRDDYCDGLGDCLPVCPTAAISFEERAAAPFDAAAVKQSREVQTPPPAAEEIRSSQLAQWPCQLRLVPVKASYFNDAELLIAADCTAFAHADFHRLMKDKITLIGCPKLDQADYSQKLAEIIGLNNIKSVTVARMQVPCCGGLLSAAREAVAASGKSLVCSVVTVATDGTIVSEEVV